MKNVILSSCLAFVAFASFAAAPEVSVDFTRDPVERGMRFDRRFAVADGVEGWKVLRGADPVHSWMRHLPFEITDPAFKNGKMPIANVEIEFWNDAESTFEAVLDTERGYVRGGSKWGGGKKWQTLRFSLEDAYFGARESLPKTDKYDLRLSAANGDWKIRRIRIIGVEMEKEPDFSVLLKIDGPKSARRKVLFFVENETVALSYAVKNRARVPFDGSVVFSLSAREGGTRLSSCDFALKLAPGAGRTLDVRFPSLPPRLKRGIYDVALEVKDAAGKVIRNRSVALGVGSPAVVGKAGSGEFRYGLDVRLGRCDQSPELMEWMALMGVDIVRTGLDMNRADDARDGIKALRRAGMDVLAVFDVPKDADENRFNDSMRRALDFVGKISAELHPPFWELGNEPDLPFFFPAGIPRYLDGFHPLYSRIKDADPKTVVMNGGLANAGHRPESPRRVVEFMDLFDTNRIDHIGYHAHGIGAKAEMRARGKIASAVRDAGKGRFRLTDTETGMAASGPEQEMKQAATCVQKFAFCQAQGDPFMIWFRLLFEHPSSYGSLYSPTSPRPVVMAYRNMVETLRGSRFSGLVRAADDQMVCGCGFERPDGRRTAVVWSDREEGTSSVSVNLGSASDVVVTDLYGNRLEGDSFSGGFFDVTVAFVPVYLMWKDGAALPDLKVKARKSDDFVIGMATWNALPEVEKGASWSAPVELEEACVANAFLSEPDASKWWQGKDDLSASLSVGLWRGRPVVRMDVKDDRHMPSAKGPAGDGTEIRITDASGKPVFACSARLMDRGEFAGMVDPTLSRIVREGRVTSYLLVGRDAIPDSVKSQKELRLGLAVDDDDGFGFKQRLRLSGRLAVTGAESRP